MQLTHPIMISSRLLPSVQIGSATIGIEYDAERGFDGRTRYRWWVDFDSASVLKSETGNDLQSGASGGTLQEGLRSLLSFLYAAGESYPDGKNAGLFAPELSEWCSENLDELSIMSGEIEETEGLIDES